MYFVIYYDSKKNKNIFERQFTINSAFCLSKRFSVRALHSLQWIVVKKKIVKMHRVDIIPLPHPHSFHSGNFIYLPTLQFEGSKGVTRKTESTAVVESVTKVVIPYNAPLVTEVLPISSPFSQRIVLPSGRAIMCL